MSNFATAIIQNTDMRTHLEASMAEQLREAYREQGPRGVLATRHAAAIHESGHGIVFARTADEVFAPPHRLSIKKRRTPLGDTWTGSTDVVPSAPKLHIDSRTRPDMLWTHGIRVLAGVAAELLFDGHDFRMGSSFDEVALAQGIAEAMSRPGWPAPTVMAEMMDATIAMLRADKECLLRIAARLERDRKIGPADMRRMLPVR